MAWHRIGYSKLTSASDTLDSGTFTTNSKYIYFEAFYRYTSGSDPILTVNSVGRTSTQFSYQRSINGGDDSDNAATTGFTNNSVTADANQNIYDQGYIINVAGQEKIARINSVYTLTGSASAAPERREYGGKWNDGSSNPLITSLKYILDSANFQIGSQITVYGSDVTPTPAVNPSYPNGAIFEESDTGKHYMFDGTDTWNEMS